MKIFDHYEVRIRDSRPAIDDDALARIFHTQIKQRSSEWVKRLEMIEPNESTTHRFFKDRL